MKDTNDESGFTLIELIITIIILGILAVSALPKFIGISGDARESVLIKVKTTIKSANDLLKIKSYMPSYSAIGVTNRPDLIDIDMNHDGIYDTSGEDVRLKWRYLDNTDITKRIEFPAEFVTEFEGIDYTFIGYDLNGDNKVKSDNCYMRYTQAQSDSIPPLYDIVTTGC